MSSSKFFKLFLGQVANKERQPRKPCVNQDQLVKLDNLVYQQRDLTANKGSCRPPAGFGKLIKIKN